MDIENKKKKKLYTDALSKLIEINSEIEQLIHSIPHDQVLKNLCITVYPINRVIHDLEEYLEK